MSDSFYVLNWCARIKEVRTTTFSAKVSGDRQVACMQHFRPGFVGVMDVVLSERKEGGGFRIFRLDVLCEERGGVD